MIEQKILKNESIVLNQKSENKKDAIERVGRLLQNGGYVTPRYIEGMQKREEEFTTYIGNGIAIPHGVNEYKNEILETGLALVQYPDGVEFGKGKTAYIVIGIAGKGNEHIALLSQIALAVQDQENTEHLRHAKTPQEVLTIIDEGSK